MGAVWLPANTPSGPTLRARAWKLSVVMSFIVAIAMLHSTFLSITNSTNDFGFLFFYSRGKHITTHARLSSSARSDFRRMFRDLRDYRKAGPALWGVVAMSRGSAIRPWSKLQRKITTGGNNLATREYIPASARKTPPELQGRCGACRRLVRLALRGNDKKQ